MIRMFRPLSAYVGPAQVRKKSAMRGISAVRNHCSGVKEPKIYAKIRARSREPFLQ